jgi:hypothetical protein
LCGSINGQGVQYRCTDIIVILFLPKLVSGSWGSIIMIYERIV